MASSQFKILTERRFAPFFWTQFFGAMNDNIFKFAFTILVTYATAEWGGGDPKQAAFLIGAIFIAPFVLFSATAGQLADKYEKSTLIRFVKNFEIIIMLIGVYGFTMKNANLLYLVTFLMGVHSTLFGPVKYAYLPQHLREEELTGGNGMVEMGTFVAILFGTIIGGELVAIKGNGPIYVAAVSVTLAIVGRIAAGFIPQSPASEPNLKMNWNPITETFKNLVIAKQNRTVFLSLLGISWLWFFGATFLTSFSSFGKDILGGNPSVVTLLLAIFSVGIAVGSLLCEVFSGDKVEIGLVPFGSIGMTVFAADLYFASHGIQHVGAAIGVAEFLASPQNWRVIADLFLLAMFAGFYSVPLYALIQSRCEPLYRARIIAACNILNALFMIASSLVALALFNAGGTIPQLFLLTAILNALVAIYIYTLVPEFLMRFLTWIFVHTIYRIEKQGLDHIPAEGPCVLVCNHVSFADAVVIGGVVRRPVRFVMDHRIFKIPVASFIFRTAKTIPIAPAKEDPAALDRAYLAISAALREGDVVCIFPEGKITADGEMNTFKGGIMKILERDAVPVVPMGLSGLWGSSFSRKDAPALTRPLRRGFLSKLRLKVGAPVAAASVTPTALQNSVAELRGEWK